MLLFLIATLPWLISPVPTQSQLLQRSRDTFAFFELNHLAHLTEYCDIPYSRLVLFPSIKIRIKSMAFIQWLRVCCKEKELDWKVIFSNFLSSPALILSSTE